MQRVCMKMFKIIFDTCNDNMEPKVYEGKKGFQIQK